MNKYISIYILLAAVVAMGFQSCNKKDDTADITITDYSVYSSATTLVSGFSLKDNEKVASNLSKVQFAIDQDQCLIYNADSLPRGTKVTALCVDVTCATTVSSREFIVKNGSIQRDTVIQYTSSTKDSIDFTGDVTLRITSRDGEHVRNYRVKVNVHKQDPDSIFWNEGSRSDLPNVLGSLMSSKTVCQDDKFLCLVHDNSGYALNSIDTLMMDGWTEQVLSLPFVPQVKSFTATADALYLLDQNGELFKSDDMGVSWVDCGVAWNTIIGGYDTRVLGIKKEGSEFKHDEYPQPSGFSEGEVGDDFPVAGMSQLVSARNKWTSSQQAMIVGGIKADGNFSNAVWGYDGKRWGIINNNAETLPALHCPVLINYYSYVKSSSDNTFVKKLTWLVMGGLHSDGQINTVTYISNDQGIHWTKGGSGLQQPAHMPSFYGSQAYTVSRVVRNSSLLAYNPGHITPVTQWDSPYIYLFGGYDDGDSPLNSIWEGILVGLTYKPVF